MIQQNDVGQEQQQQLKKKSANELTASKEQFQQWRNDWVGLLATERLRVLQGKHKFPATNEEEVERIPLEDDEMGVDCDCKTQTKEERIIR